jgi:hypothetical protein
MRHDEIHYRHARIEDFHLQVTSEATTAKLVALARNAPCLANA